MAKIIKKGKSQDWDICLDELLENKEFKDNIIAMGYL